jgi:hypothetical protein
VEPPPLTVSAYGMHLHAATTVDGRDRRRLERVGSGGGEAVARAERARALTLDGEAGEPWSDGARLAAMPRGDASPYGREGQKRSPRIWIDLGSILDRERK